jgi:hypothetical protein
VKLRRQERDYYVVSIVTSPALTGTWEASFDQGETWIDGTPSDDNWAWLVAGVDFDAAAVGMNSADTKATITTAVVPWLRNKENPVLDIQTGPSIVVVP